MAIFRRHARPTTRSPGNDRTPPVVPDHDAVVVLLSPGLVDIAVLLAEVLGPGFVVQSDGPGASGVMLVGPLGPVGVAFLRVSHPGVVLLVVDRRGSGSHAVEAVAHLEAGADGYLANPPVAEVASHVQALARRRRPAATAPAATTPATAVPAAVPAA
jgi:hypothetical protein